MPVHRDFFAISAERREGIARIARELVPGRRVALSTHINADGDGCGSETGLARLLAQRGMAVHIVNPTPWPQLFDFLLADDVEDRSADGAQALKGIDLLIVLDEAVLDHQEDGLKLIWLFDIREPANPISISTFPTPAEADYKAKGGHFGPHNIYENRPDGFVSEERIFATYQNAGIRVFDIQAISNCLDRRHPAQHLERHLD